MLLMSTSSFSHEIWSSQAHRGADNYNVLTMVLSKYIEDAATRRASAKKQISRSFWHFIWIHEQNATFIFSDSSSALHDIDLCGFVLPNGTTAEGPEPYRVWESNLVHSRATSQWVSK